MFLRNINGTWDSSVLYRHYSLPRSWRCGRINKTWSMTEKQVDAKHQTWPLIPQFSSVAQSCPTLCDLIYCSMPGLPVHHQLPEFTQIQVHWVGDAIQPSHLLSVPFSSHLQSFPGSESFPVSQFFASDQIRSDQSLSRVRLLETPWIAARQASLSITNSRSSPRLTSIESVMLSSHLILCRPLLLLPPIPPSIRVFSNESTLRLRWPKYWSFSFSISPSSEYSGLISFRMDWLDLLAVQGTLKSLLQHHRSKTSILRRWFLGPDQKLLPGALEPIWPLSWRQRERWVAQDFQRLCCVISRR